MSASSHNANGVCHPLTPAPSASSRSSSGIENGTRDIGVPFTNRVSAAFAVLSIRTSSRERDGNGMQRIEIFGTVRWNRILHTI